LKQEVIDKCKGCKRINESYCCTAYENPVEKWRVGNCPLCTTIHRMMQDDTKKKVNPLKASKKARKKKI
jgi:hypothetical protein